MKLLVSIEYIFFVDIESESIMASLGAVTIFYFLNYDDHFDVHYHAILNLYGEVCHYHHCQIFMTIIP